MSNIYKNYNPDILETIANLSNDEVFTPPKLANQILDLLPEEVWSNPSLTFLDPAVKTGIFLREIASRLIDGLADQIPDLQERVNHILTKQVFGIGITELTTLMARRTVYCSMTANGPFSIVTEFDDEKGNILLPDTEHTWNKNGRCEFCGANKDSYGGGADRESYAYPFIHDNFEKEFGNMKFDVIIGNPPYQLNVGNEGGNASRAQALYHKFVDKAIELDPQYISMIIPSRWMTQSSSGIPNDWGQNLITKNKIKEIHDYEVGDDLFGGSVGVNGGINYFIWDKEHNGKCDYNYYKEAQDEKPQKRLVYLDSIGMGFVIRNPMSQEIIKKIIKKDGEYFKDKNKTFSNIVSPLAYNSELGGNLSSKWRDYKKTKDEEFNIKYIVSPSTNNISFGWIKESQIPKNKYLLNINKVLVPSANGTNQIIGKPRFGDKVSIASETYLTIGFNKNYSKKECENIMKYISTKFFRHLVSIKKNTQNGARTVYELVPMQDWNEELKDEDLYKKYDLSKDEIDFIEKTIPEMNISKELSEINYD